MFGERGSRTQTPAEVWRAARGVSCGLRSQVKGHRSQVTASTCSSLAEESVKENPLGINFIFSPRVF